MSSEVPIVLDNGTGFVKVQYPQYTLSLFFKGIANLTARICRFEFPEHVFPLIVGRPILRAEERMNNLEIKDIMVGDEAAAVHSLLQISYLMENEIICN